MPRNPRSWIRKSLATRAQTASRPKEVWKPVSDRKIRVGIVGYGVCKFGAEFGFQNHPNVTVAAVSDLFPDRCQALAKVCRCEKTYPSLEELVKDDSLEAVFVATDAPNHAKHCTDVLRHGKHVACAVPAVFGSVDGAHSLLAAVKSSGRKYMMFETSAFREDCHAMRQIYRAGGFGKLIYAEGEYYHYSVTQLDSFRNWHVGLPPQWYPTHSNAFCLCVTGGSFTEVSCMGVPSFRACNQNNGYKNPLWHRNRPAADERGGNGADGRQLGHAWPGNRGRSGARPRGTMWAGPYVGDEKQLPPLACPPLPPSVAPVATAARMAI